MTLSLASLGWNDFFQAQYDGLQDTSLTPMRVSIEHQDRYTIVGESKHCDAHLTGLLLQQANRGIRPAVGDWVAYSQAGQIAHLFKRKTAFERINSRGRRQVISANIDLVFIVTSCNAEFNVRRLERYLSAVGRSGAESAIVLTKTDLTDSPEKYLASLQEIIGPSPIFPVATPSDIGVDALRSCLKRGKTLALVGSSGVGKSTLANALLGVELFETAAIREQDAKGRHTTTRRELVVLPEDRGILIDTPGMRELQLGADKAGLDNAFADIQKLATQCQFRDCQHKKEPKCAVRGAVPEARLRNFHTLVSEGRKERSYAGRSGIRRVPRGSTRNRKR